MKRLAAFWLAIALLMGSAWAGPKVRADGTVWLARARRRGGEVTETAERFTTPTAHQTAGIRIDWAAPFIRLACFAYSLLQRPPTSLHTVSFTR